MSHSRLGVLVAVAVFALMVGSALLAPVGLGIVPSTAAPSGGALVAAATHGAPSSVVASGPAAPSSNPAAPYAKAITINPARQAEVNAAQAQARADGTLSTFYPPTVLQAPPPAQTGGHIIPFYYQAPAAMGISDYGLSNTTGTITPYIDRTTSVESITTITDPLGVQTTNPYYSGLLSYSAQMNLDLYNVTLKGNAGNVIWLQNLFSYNPQTGSFSISEDDWNSTAPYNAYNFSASDAGAGSFPLRSTILYGTGSTGGSLDYSSSAPSFAPMHYPFTVELFTNTTVGTYTGSAWCRANPARCTDVNLVYMNYSVYQNGVHICPTGTETAPKVCGSYDTLYFNSTSPSNPKPLSFGSAQIEANGLQYTPVGMPYDIEMTLGIGSSDGSNSNDNYANATLQLFLLNATTHRMTPPYAAYDFGSGTDETAMGVYGTYSIQPNGMPIEQFRSGPPLLVGLWNASGPSFGVGSHWLNYAHIVPGNAWLAIAPGAGAVNQSYFQVAPTFGWYTGKGALGKNIWLQPGMYTVEVMLSGYNEVVQTVNLMTANASLSITLTKNPASTVYTPLYAFTNSDLANLSLSGAGTSASPYIMPSAEQGTVPLQFVFEGLNTFFFGVWSGVWFNGTTAYVDMNPPMSFYVSYPSWWTYILNAECQPYPAGYGACPYNNQLPIYLYYASNVSIAHGASVGGWTFNQVSGTYYDVYINGGTNDLLYDNYFNVSGHGAEIFGGGAVGNPTPVFTASGTTYTVTFTQSSALLPTGAPWSATLNGVTETSTTATIVFPGLTAGAYGYSVPSPTGYTSNRTSGSVTVGSANVNLLTSFTPSGTSYAVTFTESGLTSGTNWSVTFNGQTRYSVTTTAVFAGTTNGGPYSYTIGAVNGFAISPASGSITVSGANVAQTITFTAARTTVAATITESGLPTGVPWSVTLNGVKQTSLTTSVVFGGLLDGKYAFTVSSVTGFSVSAPTHGMITVVGANDNNVVWGNTFYPYVYPAYDPHNPYSGHSGVNAPSTGLTVSTGGNVIYNNAFYTNGTASSAAADINSWNATGGYQSAANSINVNGFALTGSILGQTIQGGNYWFNYGAVANPYGVPYVARASSPTGTASIGHGADYAPLTPYMPVALASSVPTATGVGLYSVTFTEAGLGLTNSWTMRIAGVPVNQPLPATTYTTNPSNTTVVSATLTTNTFWVPNGTYTWTVVTSPALSSPVVSSGTVTVNGAMAFVTVTFGWTVTVKESGLTSGLTWATTFNGKLGVALAGQWLNFTGIVPTAVSALTYSYSVSALASGWTATLQTASPVTVTNAAKTLNVTFAASVPLYSIYFTASGIFPGTSFLVSLNGGAAVSSGGTSQVVFSNEPAGSYTYTVTAPNGYTLASSSPSSPLTVTSSSVSVGVVFTPVTYTITFQETGLTSGTAWGLSFGGVFHPGTAGSGASTISFQVAAGTYNWLIGFISGFPVSGASSGTLTVAGSLAVNITFT